jgi:hypothetical protein
MRKSFLLVLIAVSVLAIGGGLALLLQDGGLKIARGAPTALPPDGIARMTVSELHAQLQGATPPLVWDLRTAEGYAGQHIPGSQRVQTDQVAALAEPLDRNRAIVTLCA